MTAIIPSARLRLLGGTSLENNEGPIAGRGAQRRRIALLAILATARRPVSRDKLIAYLWEDADTERARKLLSESLYVIRKALGEDSITAMGDAVQLNPDVIWSDVAEFTAALERNDDETAVELYSGPFLDGFFISDAAEFENWVAGERTAFARTRAEALGRLAADAESNRDFAAAVRWWRKLTEQDPYNSAYALDLMRMLDASGDRAGALQHARVHAALLRSEFDAEPDSAVESFAQSLQLATPVRHHTQRVKGVVEEPRNTAEREPTAPPAPVSAVLPPPSQSPPRRRLRVWHLVAIAALAAVVSTLLFTFKQWAPANRPAATPSLVAVLPFNIRGSATELREGMVDLLSTNLDGAGDLRSVDSHAILSLLVNYRSAFAPRRAMDIAERFGAEYYVLGDVIEAGDQLQMSATLYHIDSEDAVTRAAARGPADSLLVLVDEIATQLLAGRLNPGEFTHLAATTTRSLPALKSYLEGESHYRAARYRAAVNSFQRALNEDRNFALAEYRLSVAAEWNFEFLKARRAAERALSNSSRLTDQYQPLVRAWWYFLNGNADAAQRVYESVLVLYPSSVEARSGLGEVLVHFNQTRGLPQSAARDAFERVLALAPSHGEVRYHALEFATRDRDLARFDALLSGLEPRNPQYQSWRVVRAYTWGTTAEQASALSELLKGEELAIGIAAARLAAHTHDFAGAQAIARELTRSNRTNQWQAGGHLLLAEIHMARGEWAEAQRELTAARTVEADWPMEFAALFSLHPSASPAREDLLQQQAALLDWRPDTHSPSTTFFLAAHATVHPQLRLYLLGLVAARLGELDGALGYRRELERLGGDPASQKLALALSRSLAGHIAHARGDRARALELLTTATIEAPPEFVMLSPFYSRAHDRFVMAEINRELGNKSEAKRWYDSLVEGYDFLYAPAARARSGAL